MGAGGLDRINVQNNPVNSVDPYGLIVGVDDATIIALAAVSTVTVAYLNSPEGQQAAYQIANDLQSIGKKMLNEISQLKKKLGGPQGIQYSLRSSSPGFYPNVRGGVTFLDAGEVWKIGETINPCDRYGADWLRVNCLIMVPEVTGNQIEIKIAEKAKIYGYFFVNGTLPPGNKIFR